MRHYLILFTLTIQPLHSHGADWHRVVSDRISSREQPLHNVQTIEPCLSNCRHFKIYTVCPASPPHKPRISAICTAVSTTVSDLHSNLFPAVCEQFPPTSKGAEQSLVLNLCPSFRCCGFRELRCLYFRTLSLDRLLCSQCSVA